MIGHKFEGNMKGLEKEVRKEKELRLSLTNTSA
jgi:hypothetical protein